MGNSTKSAYQRIVIKLSGEALQGNHHSGIQADTLNKITQDIVSVTSLGVQVSIVIGAGNFIRGAELCASGIDRVTADQMGMLATVLNGLALQDALDKKGMPVALMSAIAIPGLVDIYNRRKAKALLQQGHVVIFVSGTGNPLVTTDSAAALRGIEIGADIVIKATKVDGVFDSDPIKNPKAKRYDALTYDEVLQQNLGVMDMNAILLCRDHGLPLRVFNMNQSGDLKRIVVGDNVGTLIQRKM